MRKGETIRDATHRWVAEMNAVPTDMIRDCVREQEWKLSDVTPIAKGDNVCFWDGFTVTGQELDGYGEVVEVLKEHYKVRDSKTELLVAVEKGKMEAEGRDWLPSWGTMWMMNDSADDYWIENNLEKMAQCGFRIYEHYDYGYIFGIDGGGYDFYSEHWIPLYKARGLQWHDPIAEHEDAMQRKGYQKGNLGLQEYWFDKDGNVVSEVMKRQEA